MIKAKNYMNFKTNIFFLLIFSLFLTACAEREEREGVLEKTGVELVAIGSINFGGVQLGQFRDAAIEVINYGPGSINNIEASVEEPFKIQSVSSPCNTGTLAEGQKCQVVVRFEPTEADDFNATVSIAGKTITTTGLGLLDGTLVLFEEDGITSLSSWDLGQLAAGTPIRRSTVLKNLGDIALPLQLGAIDLPIGVKLVTSSCRSILVGGEGCTLEFLIEKQLSGILTEQIDFEDFIFGRQELFIELRTNTTPREPSGLIAFEEFERVMIADESAIQTVRSLPIRDQFSNVVPEGTPIALNSIGLEIVGGTLEEEDNPIGIGKRFVSEGSAITDAQGKITFQIRGTQVKGDFGFFAIAGDANGYGSVKLISGPASGIIRVQDFPSNIIANGQQSVRLDLEPLFDQNDNLVEDGTQVFFTLLGEGNLDTNMRTTIAGSTSVVLTSSTNIGFADVLIQSGPIFDSNDNIIDYSAEGTFRVTYTPGPASGIIPVNVSRRSIYADPSDITAINTEGFPAKSQVQLGPIFDSNGNLVNFATEVRVWVANGNNITQPQVTDNDPSIFQTDQNGLITFDVEGSGRRGEIQIYVQSGAAEGSETIWGYLTTSLRFQIGLDNPLNLFQKYSKEPPAPDLKWGKAYGFEVLSFQNSNYFGFEKFNGAPLKDNNDRLPYLMWDCLFPVDQYLYIYPCKNLFGKYINTRQVELDSTDTNRFMRKPLPAAHFILPVNDKIPNSETRFCSQITNEVECETTITIKRLDCFWEENDQGGGTCKTNHPNECTPIEDPVQCEQFRSIGGRTCNFEPISGTEIGVCNADPNIRHPLLSYLPGSNTMMIFGGYTEIIGNGSAFGITSSLSTFYTDVLGSGTMNVYNITGNEDFDIGTKPPGLSMTSVGTGENQLWIYGGMEGYPGQGARAGQELYEYNNNTSLWYNIQMNPDPDLADTPQGGLPGSRYANGTHYIPDTNSLYMFGGFTQDEDIPTIWHDTDDFWKIDMSPRDEDLNSSLEWKRICSECGFPDLNTDLIDITRLGENGVGAPNDLPYNEARFLEGEMTLQLAKMVWDEIRQVAYLYWQDNPVMFKFDPFTDELSPLTEFDGGIYNLKGFRQMVYNRKVGRMFAYERIEPSQSPEALTSFIWYWDSDNEQKTYYKAVFNVGAGSKDFVQGLKPVVYAYGESTTFDNDTTPSCLAGIQFGEDDSVCYIEKNSGVEVLIYNFSTFLYEKIGENLDAVIDIDNPEPDVIEKTFTREANPNISDYIDENGNVVLLITARGVPGNETLFGLKGLPKQFRCHNIGGRSVCGLVDGTNGDACFDYFESQGRQGELSSPRTVNTKNPLSNGFTPLGKYEETFVVNDFTDQVSFGTNLVPNNVRDGATSTTFSFDIVPNKPYQLTGLLSNTELRISERDGTEILTVNNTETDNPTILNETFTPVSNRVVFVLVDNGTNNGWDNLAVKETNPNLAGLSEELLCLDGFAAQSCEIVNPGTIVTFDTFNANNIANGCQISANQCENSLCEDVELKVSCEQPGSPDRVLNCYEANGNNLDNSSKLIRGTHNIKIDHIRVEGTF